MSQRRWVRHWSAGVGLVGAMAACVPVGTPPPVDDWHWVLGQQLTIPAGRARTWFQDGRQVARVDRYRPHCELEIATVSEQPQQVRPDRLHVQRRERRIVLDEDAAIPTIGFAWPFDCNRDHFYETLFWLRAESQPGVRRLLCRDWFRSCDPGRQLSLDEMLRVLGPAFRLE